jgi:hypothetical protein
MKLSKFTQALRNIWNRLFNPPLIKQDFIDLGFTESDLSDNHNWCFTKDSSMFQGNILIHYNILSNGNRLTINFLRKMKISDSCFGKSDYLVDSIVIKNRKELKWLIDRLNHALKIRGFNLRN